MKKIAIFFVILLSSATGSCYAFSYLQDDIIYCNSSDGSRIYKKSLSDSLDGQRITDSPCFSADFSPDGQYIIYSVPSGGIYKKNSTDTADGERIVTQNASYVKYSRDGQSIFYVRQSDYLLYKKDLGDVSEGYPVTSQMVGQFSISRDGQKIVYSSMTDGKIYVKSSGDVGNGDRVTDEVGIYPSFSIDGTKILYNLNSPSNGYARWLYIKNIDDMSSGDVVNTVPYSYGGIFTNDGQSIIYQHGGEPAILYMKNSNDQQEGVQITQSPGFSVVQFPSQNQTPNQPVNSIVNGLQCTTTKFPVFSSAYWYNFGGLDNHVIYSGQQNGRNFLEYEGTSNDGRSRDSVILNDTLSGATLPILSIEYPGSQYANVDLKTSEYAGIIVQAKRNGSRVPWNILQFYGTNNEGFPGWGRGCVVSSNGSTLCDPDPIESSGGVATLSTLLSDGSYGTIGIIKYPVSGFSGIRMGLAPMAPLTECSAQNNKCQFKPIGNDWKCSPVIEGGVEVGVCGLAGSGSIYGSGACVPLTDGSGAIIQTSLPGQYTTITNPDGTTTTVRIPDGYDDWSSVFSCDVSESLSWYEALGQYAICPFVTIPTKIYKKITTPFKSVENNIQINKIDTRIYTGATGLVGSGAILSQNPLLLQFKSNLDSIGTDTQHPWGIGLRFAFALAVFAIILLVIGTYIWLLKKG